MNDIYAHAGSLPVVVLGDFNADAASAELNALRGIMWNPLQSANYRASDASPLSWSGLIDFAFALPWWQAEHWQIDYSWSSDHFPMVFFYTR